MPDVCVVYGCSNKKDKDKGISIHRIPYWNDDNPTARHRRKLWVDFVRTRRANFEPSQYSVVCSVHFKPEDFERHSLLLPGFDSKLKRSLVRDQIGVTAVPSIFMERVEGNVDEADGADDGPSTSASTSVRKKGAKRPKKSRQHRMVSLLFCF